MAVSVVRPSLVQHIDPPRGMVDGDRQQLLLDGPPKLPRTRWTSSLISLRDRPAATIAWRTSSGTKTQKIWGVGVRGPGL